MTRAELAKMTVAELRALAKKTSVTLPAGARKDDIVKALAQKGAAGKTRAKAATAAKRAAAVKKGTKAGTKTKAKAKVKAKAKAKATGRKSAAKNKEVKKTTGASAGKSVVTKRSAAKAAVRKTPARGAKVPVPAEEPLLSQEQVSLSKFFTGGPEHPSSLTSGGLPAEYGQERVVMMARDPETVFTYWEVPQERVLRERMQFGGDSRLCVRVYDVTGVTFDGANATAYFDQVVQERIGSRYFSLQRPGRRFCADIGLRAPDGRFLTLSRSNVTTVPRDAVSDVLDAEWAASEAEFARIFGVPGWVIGGMSSQQLQELVRQRRLGDVSSPGAQAGRKNPGK